MSISKLSQVVATGKMLKQKGITYELGAKAVPPNIPKSLDCSGFVRYCFLSAGYKVPDGTYHQFNESVSVSNLQFGDIGFLQLPSEKGINHIGIYLGDGVWMHCNYSRNGITIEKTNMFKYGRRFKVVEMEDDEVVEKYKIELNGVIKEVDCIKKDGRIYVQLRDLASDKIEVTWDITDKIPRVKTK